MLILPVILDQNTTCLPGLAFIDRQWASENNLQVKPTPYEITMFGFNEKIMSSVTHFATAGLRVHDRYENQLHFLVTPLGHRPVTLDMPWLKMHDPTVRWSAHTLKFDSEYCRKYCNTPLRPTRIHALHDVPKKARPEYETRGSDVILPSLDIQSISL